MKFQWRNRGGSRHRGEGVTRDISTNGMYVLTDASPPVDAWLQIQVQFPPLAEGRGLQMRTSGHVIRRELIAGGETHRGFAAACKTFVLRHQRGDLVS
ncbi:MAG: PilZ domain-containing protein [Acidobacteria bacterium]|nr:PilZ domain-containing protein [Acidobacteriota bacterium]